MKWSHQFFKQPSPLWDEVLALRLAVFVDEMGVPIELEEDEYDKTATHLCIKHQQQSIGTIGTLRLVFTSKGVKVGRVAIHSDYRRQGLGRQMMQLAIRYCRQLSSSKITLGSQTYITSFYQSLGFTQQGEVFDDAGIPHVEMYLDIEDDENRST